MEGGVGQDWAAVGVQEDVVQGYGAVGQVGAVEEGDSFGEWDEEGYELTA
ncbi:hypothetical protein OHA10_25205 [Kribbella sp. NBC_00662]